MIPRLSREDAVKMDHLASEQFGLKTEMMMEHAGRAAAVIAREKLVNLSSKRILALAGKGRNGGDALVASRFLHNWGAKVVVVMAGNQGELAGLTKHHASLLESAGVKVLYPGQKEKFEELFLDSDLIIDGLLGYNLLGNPREFYGVLIRMANNSGKKIISLDLPSGLDIDTGEARSPCIKAAITVTLGLPKKGLFIGKGREVSGEIFLVDIGIPPEVFRAMNIHVGSIFWKEGILKIKD